MTVTRLLTLEDVPALAELYRVNRDFLAPFEPVRSALITGITRALFLIGGERMILPERVQRALRYAPAAALAAVVVPDLLDTPHGLSIALGNHALYASLAASHGICGAAACSARSWSAWRSSPVCDSG